jgi:hypothetical protein
VKTAPNLSDRASENDSVICSIPEEQNESVKKGYFRSTDMFKIFLAYKGIISAGVCNFLSSLAMLTTT